MNKNTTKIAEEILRYQFTGNETIKELMNVFHSIMKKYHISRTIPSYNDDGKKVGEISDNPEWTVYRILWQDAIASYINFNEVFSLWE